MNTEDVIQKVSEERLAVENLKKLTYNFEILTPGLIRESVSSLYENSRYITATFQLDKQLMIEDITDKLFRRLHLRVLFLTKLNNGEYRSVLYSMPHQDEMYIIYILSKQHGIVNELDVAFYDSMETMEDDIWRTRNNAQGDMLQWANDVKIIKDFG